MRPANRNSLAYVLGVHLDGAKLTQIDLSHRAGLDKRKVADLLAGRDRRVDRESLSKIAFALTERYGQLHVEPTQESSAASRPKRGRPSVRLKQVQDSAVPTDQRRYLGPAHAYKIVSELFQAAGYSLASSDRGMVWQRFARAGASEVPDLRVGWYEKYPLVYGQPHSPEGIAQLVTSRLAALVGAKVEWQLIELAEIVPSLLDGSIDMLCCEYIGIESIQFDTWLSEPIPGIAVTPVAAVHASQHATASRILKEAAKSGKPSHSKIEYCHTDSIVGRSLLSAFLPDFCLGDDGSVSGTSIPGTLRECYMDILKKPKADDGRIRCFVTDSLTLIDAQHRFPKEIVQLVPNQSGTPPKYDLCFALHPDEGSRLGNLINRGLKRLESMDYFEKVAYAQWKEIVKSNSDLVGKTHA